MLLSIDEFLTKLAELLTPNPQRPRTCFLTQKRFTYQSENIPSIQHPDSDSTFKCLFRATDGHKFKFSTLVEPEHAPKFEEAYSAVLKQGLLTGLRPKKKKTNRGATISPSSFPKIVGPKRGAGVEKRRKLIKRRTKMLLKMRNQQLIKAGGGNP